MELFRLFNPKNCFILVSEPWDYVGPDGKNVINGQILKVVSDQCVLFKTNHAVELLDVKGDILVCFSRFRGDSFKYLKTKGGWIISVGLMLTDEFEQMDPKTLQEHSKFVIIGSLHKKQ